MSHEVATAPREELQRPNALRRSRRRALLSFVLSLLILPAWVYLWLRENVSGWWVVLWILAIGQLGISTLFIYRWQPGSQWRRWTVLQLAFNFVWAIAIGLVASRLSVTWMVAWYLFAAVWIGAMTLAYIRRRHKTLSDHLTDRR